MGTAVRARLAFAGAGLWHRRGVATMIVLTAMLAVASADAAFIYRDAATTSGLRAELSSIPANQLGLVETSSGSTKLRPDEDLDVNTSTLPFVSNRSVGISIQGAVEQKGSLSEAVRLASSSGQCGQVTMTSGICPASGVDAAIPASTAAAYGWHVGQTLTVDQLTRNPNGLIESDIYGKVIRRSFASPPPTSLPPITIHIVGIYAVTHPDAPYWMGTPPVTSTSVTAPSPPYVLTTFDRFASMPRFTDASVYVNEPVDANAVTVPGIQELRIGIRAITTPANIHIVVLTPLPGLLDRDQADAKSLGKVTLVAMAQLVGLLGLVLVIVLLVSSASRRTEIVASGLQGTPTWRIALAIAVEPVVLVCVGAGAGLGLAPLAVRLVATSGLRPGTPIPTLPSAGLTSILAVTAFGVLAAAVIAALVARRTSTLAQSSDPRSRAAWWEIVVFTVAAGGVVELIAAGGIKSRATPWALVAPTICGLAVALLVARGLPPLLGPLVTRTRRSKWLSLFLLVRELRRDVAAWRVTAVVAMAVSLLSFAVAIDQGAVADRKDRAGLIVGADRVVAAQPTDAADLQRIVAQADPRARWAMAAVQITPTGAPDEQTLAIQPARLPVVAAWTRQLGGVSLPTVASQLQPSAPSPFEITGTSYTVPITSRVRQGRTTRVQLKVMLPTGHLEVIGGSRLRLGAHSYTWSTPHCAEGCRLHAIGVVHPRQHHRLNVVVGGLGTGAWAGGNASAVQTVAGWHLTATPDRALLGPERIVRQEVPSPLPVLARMRSPLVIGLDGQQLDGRAATRTKTLPRVLGSGAVVDLAYLQLLETDADPGSTQFVPEVWLGKTAPPNAVSRLESLGLHVTGVQTAKAEAANLGTLDPALGISAYLGVAALAVLLALALLCGQAAVSARRRRVEFIALATAGVSRFSLGVGWFAAAAIRLGIAVGTGAATGLFIARLGASGVPLAAPGTTPKPILTVATWPAVLAAALTLLPLLIAEAGSVRWSVHTSGLGRTRESAA